MGLLSIAISSLSANSKAPVMLAQSWDKTMNTKGWWMSEKFDGVRAYWTGKELVSRSGNQFHAPNWFTKELPDFPLDGELWLGRDRFAETISIVRQQSPHQGWDKVRYTIFDAPQVEGDFEQRLTFIQDWFAKRPHPYIQLVEHEKCRDNTHLENKLRQIETLGGEGIMLRRPHSPYTVGRSKDLLKVKSYQDAEAQVIGHVAGKGKNTGRLGALWVEMPNGIRFKIGTGFSDQERKSPPPIGSTITFKYNGFHQSGIPRFASFLRVRDSL